MKEIFLNLKNTFVFIKKSGDESNKN